MTTAPGIHADEPRTYDAPEYGCGHCDVRGVTLTDCEACGEFVCASCRERLCEQPVMCQCGELRVGREITWTDCEPTCDRCPVTDCDICETATREPRGKMWRGGWLVCRECRERLDRLEAA